MRFAVASRAIILAAVPLAVWACKEDKPAPASGKAVTNPQIAAASAEPEKSPPVEIDPALLRLFAPLPARFDSKENPVTEEKVNLGRKLYFETRLSVSQQFSCNTCHGLTTYGVDNTPVSEGHKKQKGARNSPTVYNAAGHFVQFWDGRAATVEEQAKGPITNPVEMAMPDPKFVAEVLRSIPEYEAEFKKAFPADKEPVTLDNAGKAIGAFERKLVTPSRFDKFLAGDTKVLTDDEKRGLKTFLTAGCTTCHSGMLLGGTMFQKLGAVEPWPDEHDKGRYDQTKQEADKMMFKVPSLRNVAKTAPYFHDGSVPTLEQAVRLMGKHQLGKNLSDAEVTSIVTFLASLTGELPTAYVAKPELPKNGPKTPKPAKG